MKQRERDAIERAFVAEKRADEAIKYADKVDKRAKRYIARSYGLLASFLIITLSILGAWMLNKSSDFIVAILAAVAVAITTYIITSFKK